MHTQDNTPPERVDERDVTATINNADIKWVDEDEYDSRGVTVQLLNNGWLRVLQENSANKYHPPGEVVVVTPQGEY